MGQKVHFGRLLKCPDCDNRLLSDEGAVYSDRGMLIPLDTGTWLACLYIRDDLSEMWQKRSKRHKKDKKGIKKTKKLQNAVKDTPIFVGVWSSGHSNRSPKSSIHPVVNLEHARLHPGYIRRLIKVARARGPRTEQP
jgi:hypothetical protein